MITATPSIYATCNHGRGKFAMIAALNTENGRRTYTTGGQQKKCRTCPSSHCRPTPPPAAFGADTRLRGDCLWSAAPSPSPSLLSPLSVNMTGQVGREHYAGTALLTISVLVFELRRTTVHSCSQLLPTVSVGVDCVGHATNRGRWVTSRE